MNKIVLRANAILPRGLFFDLAFLLYMIQALSKITYIGVDLADLSGLAVLVPAFCLLQELLQETRSKADYLVLAIFCAFTLLQHIFGGRNLVALFLLLYVSRNLPIRHIYSVLAVLLAGSLVVTVILAECGVITNYVAYREGSGIARYGLGFIGYTYSSYFPFVIASVYALRNKDDANLLIIALLFIVDCWIYFQTNTRSGFILTIVVLALLILNKLKLNSRNIRLVQNQPFLRVASLVYILAFLVFAVLVAWYFHGGMLIEQLNVFMSQRLDMTTSALGQYGVTVFGTTINWTDVDYIVDNSYFRVLIEYGPLAMLTIVAVMTCACRSFVQRGDYLSLVICALFAFFFSFDPTMISAFFNPILFCGVNSLKETRIISALLDGYESVRA